MLLMELYKERGINPFSSIGTLVVQLVILIGLFSGLRRVIDDPMAIVTFAYGWVQNLPLLQEIAQNPALFDNTLFGVVDLSRAALGSDGLYMPAMILVIGSAVTQFYQSSQLMPNDKDARGLRQILREASEGKQADASETNAAVGRSMRYFIPVMIFVFTVGFASALSLYWFMSGLVGYWQQSRILSQDETEMEEIGASQKGDVIEGEVIEKSTEQKAKELKAKKAKNKKKSSKSGNKRRKK